MAILESVSKRVKEKINTEGLVWRKEVKFEEVIIIIIFIIYIIILFKLDGMS